MIFGCQRSNLARLGENSVFGRLQPDYGCVLTQFAPPAAALATYGSMQDVAPVATVWVLLPSIVSLFVVASVTVPDPMLWTQILPALLKLA